MEVAFTKLAGRRYVMAVARSRGPELAPRQGPGYHDDLPHDLAHFVVEAEAGLAHGVFGQIAAGRSNLFSAADPKVVQRQHRREARQPLSSAERDDLNSSERLASLAVVLWELRAGRRSDPPTWLAGVDPVAVGSPLMERILGRLDEVAARWQALPDGDRLTLEWPERGPGGTVHALGRGSPAGRPRSGRRSGTGAR